jgi:protein ATS1
MPPQLLAQGANESWQLSIPHTEDAKSENDVSEATLTTLPAEAGAPRQIVGGRKHTLIRCESGRVWAVGSNNFGQCGTPRISVADDTAETADRRPRAENNTYHHTINSFQGVTFKDEAGMLHEHFGLVSATWDASFFVTVGGDRVFVCGHGGKGELGLGESVIYTQPVMLDLNIVDTNTPLALQIPNFPPEGTRVIQIVSCVYHTVALLSNREVYGWGRGRLGQLGLPYSAAVWTPRKVTGFDFAVERVACGREFTYLVGIPSDGKHLVIGNDSAVAGRVVSEAPESITGWKDIGCRWRGIFVLKQDGSLVSWGASEHDKRGWSKQHNVEGAAGQLMLVPSCLGPLDKMAVGSAHNLGRTKDGLLIAWGWNVHHECGRDDNIEQLEIKDGSRVLSSRTASQLLEIPNEKASILDIWAGCSTSWIWISDGEEEAMDASSSSSHVQ